MQIRIGEASAMLVPTEKRVRVFIGSDQIVDSASAMILRQSGKPVNYVFPADDIDLSLLAKENSGEDLFGRYDTYSTDKNESGKRNVLNLYTDANPGEEKLIGHAVIDWKQVDRFMEENQVMVGHPRDPYTRIDVLESDRRVEYWMKGEKIAETSRPRILYETGLPSRYYIPQEDARMELLFPSEHETVCPYKGVASYWDLKIGGEIFKHMVWSYLDPFDEAMGIKGYLGYYAERLQRVLIDGREV